MIVHKHPNGIFINNITDFDLEQTLDCGQCFRFSKTKDGGWYGFAGNRVLTLRSLNAGVLFENISLDDFEGFWRQYFDFDRDYAAIRSSFPDHPALRESTNFNRGMRILRQDSWETLISFIISQNNNIPRIKGIIERLCRAFGEQIANGFGFPSSTALSVLTKQDLEVLRCGWRTEYILDAAQKDSSGQVDLAEIAAMPLDHARKALQTIKGVGPKVAECVLLYGMGRMEAFPLDVWIKRAMKELFPGFTPQSFGQYAGIAHYCRCNPESCRK